MSREGPYPNLTWNQKIIDLFSILEIDRMEERETTDRVRSEPMELLGRHFRVIRNN